MKIDEEMISFIDKLILKAKDTKSLQDNLKTYRDYLVLTELYSEEELNFIDKIITQAPNIIGMKNDFGVFEIKALIDSSDIDESKKVKKKNRHYEHYTSYPSTSLGSYSNGCGSTTVYRGC